VLSLLWFIILLTSLYCKLYDCRRTERWLKHGLGIFTQTVSYQNNGSQLHFTRMSRHRKRARRQSTTLQNVTTKPTRRHATVYDAVASSYLIIILGSKTPS